MSGQGKGEKRTQDRRQLSLHPLEFEEALKGAMATGKPPERPKRKRMTTKRESKRSGKESA